MSLPLITVQLEENGPITEADDSLFTRSDGVLDNDHEHTTWVEYRSESGRVVHRSVHVTLKEGIGIEAVLGQLG